MNLDLIRKLIRLANNNPNDNEANLAARKVCKLLADEKIQIGPAPVKSPISGTTWNDVVRSTEPMWRSTPPKQESYQESYHRTTEGYYSKWSKGSWDTPPRNEKKKQEVKTWTCTICYKDAVADYYQGRSVFVCSKCKWDKYEEEKRIRRETQILNCTVCGKPVKTSFVGHPGTFRCYACP